MKEYSQQLSSLIDNEHDDKEVINDILNDQCLQNQFARYQLIGDIIRNDCNDLNLNIDVSASVMTAIANEEQEKPSITQIIEEKSNVVSFMKRFGQYAIAASVAGVVVVSSLVVNQDSNNDPSVTPVLSTVPFGGTAAPVSLEAPASQTKNDTKGRDERIEALLKDHQLQLQTQP